MRLSPLSKVIYTSFWVKARLQVKLDVIQSSKRLLFAHKSWNTKTYHFLGGGNNFLRGEDQEMFDESAEKENIGDFSGVTPARQAIPTPNTVIATPSRTPGMATPGRGI